MPYWLALPLLSENASLITLSFINHLPASLFVLITLHCFIFFRACHYLKSYCFVYFFNHFFPTFRHLLCEVVLHFTLLPVFVILSASSVHLFRFCPSSSHSSNATFFMKSLLISLTFLAEVRLFFTSKFV